MRLLLIHTGGTIGMIRTQEGFAPKKGVVENAVRELSRELEFECKIDIETLEPLIDSAQSTPLDWYKISQLIYSSYSEYDAFVVTHGTDTLAYMAGALCLSLPGLNKAVVVTGSMLPLSVENSDGKSNIADSIELASSKQAGVWVQFAGRKLHGARVRKSHTSSIDAFDGTDCTVAPAIIANKIALNVVKTSNIGVFSIMPGVCSQILSYAVEQCSGLLLRCYGSGTAPDTAEMRSALKTAYNKGVPVIAVSQCPEGGIKLGTYAAGQVLRDTGVIDGRDITPEMAYVKLHFSMSCYSEFEDRRNFLKTAYCGEFTPEAVLC